MQEEQPLKPANILNIVATNQGHKELTCGVPKLKALSSAEVTKMMAEGVVVVDARSSADFGAGHIKGAYNVQMSSKEFEQRVGWVTPDNAKIILVAKDAAAAKKCAFNMGFIALDSQLVGYLDGGMEQWMDDGNAVETVPQMDVHTLHHKLSTNGLYVIDARDKEEWDEGHIVQAHALPYVYMTNQLTHPNQLPNLDVPLDASVAVTCATGKRSSTAISMMLRQGYSKLYNVTGGMEAWENAGLPMVDGAGNACAI